jgi:SAM-dependent methyltransferase
MAEYALLILPSANRVYAGSAVALTRAELAVFSAAALGGRVGEIGEELIGGVPYVTFAADPLTDADVAYLANLSAAYALFERAGDLLRPVGLHPLRHYDDDLITIQKYAGKTNEQFTRLLLNVTALSSRSAAAMLGTRLAVLDPLCGRGTTLNQALSYGYDAAGIDLDRADFDAYSAFITTWLTRKRVKHHADYRGPVRREGKIIGRRLQIRLASTREAYKQGETQLLDVVCADTARAGEFFRPASQDLIVTDAPYGIQHGSRTAAGLTRSPLDLLAAALPGWVALLRPGGAVGIAWNTLVARRADAVDALAKSGLDVLDDGPYREFGHRVDQAVQRDILIGVRR